MFTFQKRLYGAYHRLLHPHTQFYENKDHPRVNRYAQHSFRLLLTGDAQLFLIGFLNIRPETSFAHVVKIFIKYNMKYRGLGFESRLINFQR